MKKGCEILKVLKFLTLDSSKHEAEEEFVVPDKEEKVLLKKLFGKKIAARKASQQQDVKNPVE